MPLTVKIARLSYERWMLHSLSSPFENHWRLQWWTWHRHERNFPRVSSEEISLSENRVQPSCHAVIERHVCYRPWLSSDFSNRRAVHRICIDAWAQSNLPSRRHTLRTCMIHGSTHVVHCGHAYRTDERIPWWMSPGILACFRAHSAARIEVNLSIRCRLRSESSAEARCRPEGIIAHPRIRSMEQWLHLRYVSLEVASVV